MCTNMKTLFRSKMSTLAKSEVRENLDGLLLLLHDRLNQVLNREHATHLAFSVEEREMADVFGEHLRHARVHTVIGRGSDEVGRFRTDFLDLRLLRFATEECDLGDVIALTDHTGYGTFFQT